MQLGVPSGSLYANVFDFETVALADGAVNFDALCVGLGNDIYWFSQHGSESPDYFLLDTPSPGLPVVLPYSFSVQAGDHFGFELVSGSDAVPPGSPPMITLTVRNLSGPIPEPGIAWCCLPAALMLVVFLRRRE